MNDMTDLMRALRMWQAEFPDEFGPCCSGSHHWPRKNAVEEERPLPDNLVCEREQAWRRYVRLRDTNPEWPWNPMPKRVKKKPFVWME